MSAATWCDRCCTQHGPHDECPGELTADGPERHGWRANVVTPQGMQAFGVLIAPCNDRWRARVLTYPRMLWVVPGGSGTLKFVGATPREAEAAAVAFIREHCRQKRFTLRVDPVTVESESVERGGVPESAAARRKIRFLPLWYGARRPSLRGGTGNVSETGLFIIGESLLGPGTKLRMRLSLDGDEHLDLEGDVRWSRDQPQSGSAPGMGVCLHAPPPSYVRFVRGLT